LINKWRARRQRLALGPDDDDLRELLVQLRDWFEEFSSRPQTSSWFRESNERKDAGRTLRDLAERRTDRSLKISLTATADAWEEVFGYATPSNHSQPSQYWVEDLVARAGAAQMQAAMRGLAHAKAALARLNELERRTHGRS
jgi:hypothetical protein